MKNNTKGFTLIELLAVIVVLAIIALIATPIVLNLIDKARKGAAESSAYAYVNAAEKAAVVALMYDNKVQLAGQTCTVQSAGKELKCGDTILTVEIKGDLPVDGDTITFGANGSVTGATFNINDYTVVVDASGKAKVSE